MIPCNEKGKEYTDADDKFVEDPELLMGQGMYFVAKIVSARGLPNKFTVREIYCCYHFLSSTMIIITVIAITPSMASKDYPRSSQ